MKLFIQGRWIIIIIIIKLKHVFFRSRCFLKNNTGNDDDDDEKNEWMKFSDTNKHREINNNFKEFNSLFIDLYILVLYSVFLLYSSPISTIIIILFFSFFLLLERFWIIDIYFFHCSVGWSIINTIASDNKQNNGQEFESFEIRTFQKHSIESFQNVRISWRYSHISYIFE